MVPGPGRNLRESLMISVIIPVYKAEQYIQECVDSVLSQTYENFELILIDDGSPDKSGQICDQYALLDPRVKVIHQANRGVSAARNAGMQCASGSIFCFIDADDYVDRDYLRILRDRMLPGGMAVCEAAEGMSFVHTDHSDLMTPEEAQISAFSLRGIGGQVWGKLFDAGVIRNSGLAFRCDLAICEDLLFVIRYLKEAPAYTMWNHSALYYYRDNLRGSTKKRFRRHRDFSAGELTEFTALKCCGPFLYAEEEIRKAYTARTVKAAVNTLRAMTANHIKAPVRKQKLRKLVRKNTFGCIRSPYLTTDAKVSVCTAALSPGLELLIWKIYNRNQ